MRNIIRTLAVAATMVCVATATAAAQSWVDHIKTSTATAAASGMLAAGTAGATGRGAAAPVTPLLVRSEASSLSIGLPPQQAVGEVLSGRSNAALDSLLTAAGAPSAQVASLMSWLTALAYSPSSATLSAAMQSYNTLVKAAPAAFVNSPPAEFLAIRAALIAIWMAR
jgi:hypothetical protein